MRVFLPAVCWAIAMMMLALGARIEWVEREAALTLLLVMPLLAFATITRGACGTLQSRGV